MLLKIIWDRVKSVDCQCQKQFLDSIRSSEQFFMILEHERARADRIGYKFSIVVFNLGDGDDHLASAERLALVLKRRVRLSDVVGWLDKQEIGVILTGTEAEGAWKFADEIRKKIVAVASNLTFKVYSYPNQWFPKEWERPKEPQYTELPHHLSTRSVEGIESLLVPRMSIWKRCIDIAGSIIGLFLFSPVMLAAGIAIKLNSPGPIIFKQERVGLLGKKFTFLKFRSMYVNGNSDLHKNYIQKFIKQSNQGQDHIYKIKDDPRVTPVGKILRKTSLDELPQLINVLKGEMSLVGPRPPIQYECEHYDQWHQRRVLEVKPGITGLWQIKGRSRTAFDEMVRLDLKYIMEWSLWLDIKILFQTVRAVLFGKGAY